MTILLGLIVGLVLGLTGAGGSVFAVPLLMFGLGWSLPQAAPVALIAVCAAAAFGTVTAWDVTYVRYRAALLMAGVGMLTAPIGLQLSERLPGNLLRGLFACVLVVVAVRMILQARRTPDEAKVVWASVSGDDAPPPGPVCGVHPVTGRLLWSRRCKLVISSIGLATGFLSGLLGVGGGFVIVPALRTGTALSLQSAISTSIMAIALTSAGTVLASLALGKPMPWLVALPFVAGALGGMLAGRKLAPRLAGPVLQQAFAVVMVMAAALIVLR